MKARLISVLILAIVISLISCKIQDEPNEQLWVSVDLSVSNRSQSAGGPLKASSDSTVTSLIIAVPATTTAVTITEYLNSNDLDRGLLSSGNTVSLTIPIDYEMRLIRVNFDSELALTTIESTQPEALEAGVSDIFIISADATSQVVAITIESEEVVTPTPTTPTTYLRGEGVQGQALSISGVVTTFAGSGNTGNSDATGDAASFNYPHDICTDGTYIYVADKFGQYIRRINIASQYVETIAGDGTYGTTEGDGSGARFGNPAGITTDGTYLYVVDQGTGLLRRITMAPPWTVDTIAGGNAGGGTPCTGSNITECKNGNGTDAQFYEPVGITYTGGTLYIVEFMNHRVRKYDIASGDVTTFAGEGSEDFLDEVTGTAAKFNDPHDITTDGTNLYVVDQDNNRIRKIVIATRYVSTFVGRSGTTASVDGDSSTAETLEPEGITTDGTYLYFTDWGDGGSPNESVIRRTLISTGYTETIAGGNEGGGTTCDGVNTTDCKNGTGDEAQFYQAHDLTSDGTYVYLADFLNDRIRRIE